MRRLPHVATSFPKSWDCSTSAARQDYVPCLHWQTAVKQVLQKRRPATICHYQGKGDATGCEERRNCHEAAVKSGGKALNMYRIAGNKLFQVTE